MLQLLEKRIYIEERIQVYSIETAPSLEEACRLHYKNGYKKGELKDAIELKFKPTTELLTWRTAP